MPGAGEDFEIARDFITTRVETLIERIGAKRCASATQQGVRYGYAKSTLFFLSAGWHARDRCHPAAPAQAAPDERTFRAAARQPLRKQLRRRATAAERHSGAPCGPRLGAYSRVRDQWPQARRAERRGLRDPARNLFRFAGWGRRRPAHRS